MYRPDQLIRSALDKAEALERTPEVGDAILQLQKMLLISDAFILKVDDFNVCGFGMGTDEDDLVRELLPQTRHNSYEIEFSLGLLSYLQSCYEKSCDDRASYQCCCQWKKSFVDTQKQNLINAALRS